MNYFSTGGPCRDVNWDGEVDISDVILCLRAAVVIFENPTFAVNKIRIEKTN